MDSQTLLQMGVDPDDDGGAEELIFRGGEKSGTNLHLYGGELFVIDFDGNYKSIELPDELYQAFWEALKKYKDNDHVSETPRLKPGA